MSYFIFTDIIFPLDNYIMTPVEWKAIDFR